MPTKIIILLLITANLFHISCKEPNGSVEKKQNVLFILVDDLGLVDLGVTGSKYYETPNIDALAKQGVIFRQVYAASRVCSPSRASIMTGKFTARHGITDWIGAKYGKSWREQNRHDKLLPAGYVHSLPEQEISLAEALKDKGYRTFYSGKWHLGNEGSYPENHGFDINIGGWEKGSPIGGYFSPWDNPRLDNRIDGENLSIRLARETAAFIKENKDVPFFVFLSFYAVHGPIQTTSGKWDKYRDKAEKMGIAETGYKMESVLPIRQVQDNPIYAGLVETMDEAVGVVLNALREENLENETMVVFTSDNGGVSSGDSFSTSNLPLRGGKGYQWEGGIREPYFIKVPWLQGESKESNYPVSGTDFYPTILDVLGLETLPDQHLDGISLKPILEGEEIKIKRPLYWHYPHYGNQGGKPSSILQEDGWKLIHYWEDDRDELYRLSSDIGEESDLAAEQSEITSRMRIKLLAWLTEVGAKLPKKDSEYNAELAEKRYQRVVNDQLTSLEKQRCDFLSKSFRPNSDWWGSKVTID